MRSNVENLGALERSVDISVSPEKVQEEVGVRLKRLAKTAKMHGFRPGKIPLKIITQQYGTQVQQDVLSDALKKNFNETVQELNLQIAGYPRFETKKVGDNDAQYEFSVRFEVYPDVVIGELDKFSVDRLAAEVNAEDIEKTLEIIRKQKVEYQKADRSAMTGDRVNIDYHGVVDGYEFAGNKAENVSLILGEGKFLKDFEASLVDVNVGENKSFEVIFPEDYHGKEVAGKTVTFEVKLNGVEAPILPEVDAVFAKSLGISDGDVEKMRQEIRLDLEREISKRIQTKLKEQVMQSLLDATQIEAPKALVDQEIERLTQSARSNLEARGMKNNEMPLGPDLFKSKAEYRVKLGLILAELVKTHELKAQPEQVRKIVEDAAKNYENPDEVVKWHYASAERLKEADSLALEENVVKWALEQITIVDKTVTFDELMRMS